VQEPFKDWSGFAVMALHLYSTAPSPVRIVLRLDDRSREPPASERAEYVLRVVPGENDFFIPLEALAQTLSGRAMNMSRIRRFGLYLAEPAMPMRIYLHRIRVGEQ
jgi:hypothetical protein